VTRSSVSRHESWARLRFSVVGPLLSSPPSPGELRALLQELSERHWQHPIRPGEQIRFSFSTIERWYYTAKEAGNPIDALRRSVREDAGGSKVFHDSLAHELTEQYHKSPHWTYQLHHANLAILVDENPLLGPLPSYPTLLRFMKARGLVRTKRTGNERRPGLVRARERLDRREVRSFEVEHTGGLWHLDFHTSRHNGVLTPEGQWIKPHLLAILDDRSRLCCHAQFYLEETTEDLVHGLSQALLKRGLPRSLLTDNGGAMIAAESVQGLEGLSVLHETTLPYSPHQNGKQEHFWAVVETRFLAMLDNVRDLTLDRINALLHAWIEGDYHQKIHSETKQTPIQRWLDGPDVTRPAPSPEKLREVFRQRVWRRIRRSDVTLTIESARYEVPYAYRHLGRVRVAYARWDLGFVHLVDPRTGRPLVRIYPLDRGKNATGQRRSLDSKPPSAAETDSSGELPPLMRRLLEDYAASGLPPAYIPKSTTDRDHDEEDKEDR